MNIWNTFMCKWMNERIMEKVLDFLEDKKYTIVRMWWRYIQMARTGRPKAENPKTKESGCTPDGIWVCQIKRVCQASQSNTCTNIAIRSREDDCFVVNSYRFFLVYHNKKGMVWWRKSERIQKEEFSIKVRHIAVKMACIDLPIPMLMAKWTSVYSKDLKATERKGKKYHS